MVGDQPHEVSSDQESQFLKDNPNATLQDKESNNSKPEKDPNNLFINEKLFKPVNTDVSYYFHKDQNNWHRFDPKTGEDKVVATGYEQGDASSELNVAMNADSESNVDYNYHDNPMDPKKDLYSFHDPDYSKRFEDDKNHRKSLNEKSKPKKKKKEKEVKEKQSETTPLMLMPQDNFTGPSIDVDSTPDQVLDYNNAPEWFNNRASNQLWPKDERYSERVYEAVMSGTHGFNPKTGQLVLLDEPIKIDPAIKEISVKSLYEKQNSEKLEERSRNNDAAITEGDLDLSESELEKLQAKESMPTITQENLPRFEGDVKIPGEFMYSDTGPQLDDVMIRTGAKTWLTENYGTYGFKFEQDGKFLKQGVVVTASNGEKKEFSLSDSNVARDMDAWMRSRAVSPMSRLKVADTFADQYVESKTQNIPADLNKGMRKINKIRELWGLEGYSNDQVRDIYQDFINKMNESGMGPKRFNVNRQTATPAFIDNLRKEGKNEQADFYERRSILDMYTGHMDETYRTMVNGEYVKDRSTQNEKDGNIFETKRLDKFWDGGDTYQNMAMFDYNALSDDFDFNAIANAEKGYKESKALQEYEKLKQTENKDFNLFSGSDEEIKSKIEQAKKDPEYLKLYQNLKVDNDEMSKYILKQHKRDATNKYYNEGIEQYAKTLDSGIWFDKSMLSKEYENAAEVMREEVIQNTTKQRALSDDYQAKINKYEEIGNKLNTFNNTYEEELKNKKIEYNIDSEKKQKEVVNNIKNDVEKNVVPKLKEKYKFRTDKDFELIQKNIQTKIKNEVDKELKRIKSSNEFDLSTEEGVALANKKIEEFQNLQIEKAEKDLELINQEEKKKYDDYNKEVNNILNSRIKKYEDDQNSKIKKMNEDPFFTDYKNDVAAFNLLKEELQPTDEEGNPVKNKYTVAFEKLEKEKAGFDMTEDELNAATSAFSKSYDLGTRLSYELMHAAIDLGQGVMNVGDMFMAAPKEIMDDLRKSNPVFDAWCKTSRFTIGNATYKIKDKDDDFRPIEQFSNRIDKWQEKTRERYSRLIQFDEIEGFADAGEWALGTMITQLPQLGLMYVTGGSSLYILGASSAGSKFDEMNQQLRQFEKTNGQFGQDFSFTEMFLNASFTGFMEAASESITLAQIEKLKDVMGGNWKIGFTNGLKKNVFNFSNFKNNTKMFFVEGFEEGFSESIAQISSNFADIASGDKDAYIWDGVPEAAASGFVISTGIKIPALGKSLRAPFISKDANQRLGEIGERIQDLTKQAGNSKNAEEIGRIETEIAELTFESGEIIQNTANRVDLIQSKNPQDIKSLINIERKTYDLRKKAEEIQLNDKLSPEQKQAELKKLVEKRAEYFIQKDSILKKYRPADVQKYTKERIQTMQEMANMAEEHGAPKVNIKEVNKDEFAERESKYDQNKSKKQIENISLYNQGLTQGLQNIIEDKNSTKEEVKEAKEALKKAETQIRIADNILKADDYGVMQPKFDKNGNIESMDILINKDAVNKDGKFNTAAHEFIHATFANTLKFDPAMRAIAGGALNKIINGKGIEFAPGMAEVFNKRVAQYPPSKQGEEGLAILSEMMLDNQVKLTDSVVGKFGNVFRRYTQNVKGYDIEFNTPDDIRNFLKDYHYSIKNNKPSPAIAKMLAKGANGKMFEDARTPAEIKAQEAHSKSVKQNMQSNPDLKPAFDNLVQVENGDSKFKNNDDFKTSPEFHEGYSKIVDSQLLDGLIKQGMIERGLPPEALRDFTRKVKEELGLRYLNNYDVSKNDSLFGWLTGVSGGAGKSIIYRAKGDVINQYIKEGKADDVSIDKQIGESGTLADVIQAETDTLIDQIDNADMTPTKKRDLKNNIEDLKMAMEVLNLPENTKKSIIDAVNSADVNLKGLSYKGIRDLLLSTQTKATTEKKVTPTGPLFGVLNAIAAEFGIDPLRILAKQDLSSEQRKLAQQYILKKAINEDGSFNKDILEMLPDGQDRSGKATGIANTKLGEFYTKGKRAKMSEGATGAGLATQTKRTDVSKDQFLNLFGINPDGSFQPGRKADGAIRELVTQIATLTANQQIRLNAVQNSLAAESEIAVLRDGMSEKMYNKKVQEDGADIEALSVIPDKYENKNNFVQVKATKGGEVDAATGVTIVEGKFGEFDMIDLDADHISKITGEPSGLTQGEYILKSGKAIIEADPRMWQIMYYTMTGSIKRQSLMTKENFIEMFGKDPYNAKKHGPPLNIPRIKYTKKQKDGAKVPVQDKSVLENFNENDYKNKIPTLIKAFKVIEKVLDTVDGNPEYADFVAQLISDTVNNTAYGITRISAPTYFALVDPATGKIDYITQVVEEHAAPQKKLVANVLFNAARLGIVDSVAPLIESYFKQGSLAHIDDVLVNQNFGQDMPRDFYDNVLPMLKDGTYPSDLKDLSFLIRYVQPHKIKNAEKTGFPKDSTQYIDMNKYVVLAGVHKGKTFAEALGVGMKGKVSKKIIEIQNNLMRQVLNGQITKEAASETFKKLVPESVNSYYKNLEDNEIAINNKLNLQNQLRESENKYSSKSKVEVKGASVFDFDDTLGITKSGVRARVPNVDGDPKPSRKVVFLAGGAGSGKSNIVRKLKLEGQGFKIVNSDISLEWLKKNSGLPADMKDLTKEQRSLLGKLGAESRKIARRKMMKYQGNANGVVVDGTGGSMKQMQKLVKEFQDKGYDVSMLFVETSLDTALERNRNRKERTLLDTIVKRNHEAVQGNKDGFKELFGKNFMEVSTDNMTLKDSVPKELAAKMNNFVSGYEKLRLDATEFAEHGDSILEKGGEFDFTEFDQVVEGRPGPLLDKAKQRAAKYGTKDIFVLTARTQKSAKAIQQFLKSQGLDIPLQNITGLANSTGDAKAQWMLEKYAEGYNDMYFADDALQNVEAVKEVLDQLDIKSDVVQAKLNQNNTLVDNSDAMKSKVVEPNVDNTINQQFNEMLERKKGISAVKVVSEAESRRRGSQTNIARFFKSLYIPPSAEDFKGLMYYFVGKGKQGDADLKWFKEKLFDPFAKGIRSWNAYKQNMVNEYRALKKKFPKVTKSLNKLIPGTVYTNDTAIRAYLFDKAGHDVPGLSQAEKKQLIDHVKGDPSIQAFADALSNITRSKDGYPAPTENWSVSSIPGDMNSLVNKVGRKQFLQEWINQKNNIFTKDNLNKIRAVYGNQFYEALNNILYRMENGGNRLVSPDSTVNGFVSWINGSVGAIMFFNMRSALLQTISTVNFINWSDNNIFKASAAFANQPQFWKDFVKLFNSDQLKQRRQGLQTDVSASELTKAFAERKMTPASVVSYLLSKGFTPTQIADSFAIAFGGASFYRNRYNKYIKEGRSPKDANEQAMLDFQEIAEETQQSSREDLVSQQQSSVLGRMVLAFQNVTMQMGRLTKKAMSDLKNGRGDFKTNVSKIVYYGVAQNIVFAALQTGLAALMFGDDQEEIDDRTQRALNQALDSFLRGTGLYGALVSTLKNTIIQWHLQKDKPFGRRDKWKIAQEMASLSPPIGAKMRKIMSAFDTEVFNEGVGKKLGFRVENPEIQKWAKIIEATTNLPLARIVNKANNLEEAITGNHLLWQKAGLILGWSRWDVGIKDEELVKAKEEVKEERKEQKKIEKEIEKEEKKKQEEKEKKEKGIKKVRCSGTRSNGTRCKLTTETSAKSWKCVHHAPFKDGSDTDGDGKKEYRCIANKSNGQRCKNKTENTNKKCYAHQ